MNRQPFEKEKWESSLKSKGFFRSYGRDWGKVCGCNALLLFSNMIPFVIGLCMVMFLFPLIFPSFTPDGLREYILNNGMADAESATEDSVANVYYMLCMLSSLMLSGMLLVVNGPFYSAVSFYFRNMLTGEDSLKKDLKQGLKDNWKQSIVVSLISIVITAVLLFNIGYYQRADMGTMSLAAKSFFSVLLAFWCCMQLFIYPLIATVELSIKEIYRNATIMAVKNFPVAIGIFFLQIVLFLVIPFVAMLSFGQIGYAITMLLYLLFSFGFISYISMYITWKAIQKIIQNNG